MVAKTGFQVNGFDFTDTYVRSELFTEGGLWLWGKNNFGQLGDNSIISKSSPVQTVAGGTNWKQVSMGSSNSATIKSDGTLWTFGLGNGLGDNTAIAKSSPVQTVAGGTNWKQVIAGFQNAFAIKTDGTLWCWGDNSAGQLGDNTVIAKSSPVQTVAAGTNWKMIAFSLSHLGSLPVAAIKTDGTLWCWGSNAYGQLGDNTVIAKSSPVQTVSGGTNWKMVACGRQNLAAIKTDGSLWIWGRGTYLGDNTSISKSSPVQTVAGGTNWKQVSCGVSHTVAIKTDGTLWGWGSQFAGSQKTPLGDNTTISRSSPVQTVSGGTNWKMVACGGYHTSAIKTDGTLWTWGCGTDGQIGNNTGGSTAGTSSPVQTVAGGTNWKFVAGGGYNTVVIRDQW